MEGTKKMKLVTYEIDYVRGEYKGACHIPVEYKSKKAIKKMFARLAKKHFNCYYANVDNRLFEFCGHFFDSHDYYYKFTKDSIRKIEPEIYTLEEWFDKFHTKDC